MAETSRDLFASRLGMLAATLGSSVGLGNIWKFPALTGEHGGASFLLVYILSTLVVGLPLMIAELLIGRSTRSNAYQAFKTLSSNRFWWIIGGLGIAGAVTILSFYSDVAGWVFAYIPKALTGSVHTQDPAVAKEAFSSLLACPWKSLFWQWLVLGLTASVILRGASGGIEKATRILIPLLFILLVVVCIRSLTLPNAMEGLKFLFMPDFSRIDGSVVLMAMGLAFFKMSIGFGCMITYGSYFRSDTHVPFLAVRVMVCDLLVSILAGIAVFASMPGGQLFTTLFFVLSAVASMGAMLSLLEVPVAWLSETFRISRPRATVLMTLALILLGAPATLSTSVLSDVTVFGLSLFDLYDFLSSNLMLPLDGLLLSLFVGYVWSRSDALDALTNGGTLHNLACAKAILFLCRYVTPILIVIILLNGLKVF